jgi:hypothetical protein
MKATVNKTAITVVIIRFIYFPPVSAEFGGTELQKGNKKP